MAHEIGIRVGALSHATESKAYLFGYGVYEGRIVPPKEIGFPVANPCIKLDSGKRVWGVECWWGPEAKIKEMIGTKQVVEVDIDEYRKASNESK